MHESESDTNIVRKIDKKFSIGVPSLDSIYDQQLVLFHMRPRTLHRQANGTCRGSVDFRFSMRTPAIARENARIAVATPSLIRQRSCRLFDEAPDERRLGARQLSSITDLGCIEVADSVSSIQNVELELPALNVRIDYLYPQPPELGRRVA